MSPEPVAILSAARTPFGRFGGSMASLTIPEVGTFSAGEALRRSGLQPEDVDELALGVNLPGSDRSIARQLSLRLQIPDDRVAYTVDRACCSSLTAVSLAARSLRVGDARVAVAGGAENMSRVPYFLENLRWGHRLGDVELKDQLVISCPHTGVPRAIQASDQGDKHGIGREEQDRWALRSQQRASEAIAAGRFEDEVVSIEVEDSRGAAVRVVYDEAPRPETTLERLAGLPTVYGSATVTAGNAPGMSTGASAVVMTSMAEADRRGLAPLATLLATAAVSAAPAEIASVPATAIRMALAKAGVALGEIDRIEINEAFAVVPLVSTLLLAEGHAVEVERLRSITNVNGGAIALGHPTGATGARLLMTAIYELRRLGGGLAVVGLCGGIGEAEAAVVHVAG